MIYSTEKLAKTLFFILIMVISINVLTVKIPESKIYEQTVQQLESSQNTVMKFSGASLSTSLALSALPDDFASPLAKTVSDFNTYFVFILAVLFVEKLIVLEGTKIGLTILIPAACVLYIINIWHSKAVIRSFANKLLILGISLVIVIPFSTHFNEYICSDYMAYVEETIEETNNGAAKINDVMASGSESESFFDKLSEAFKSAIQGVTDLLTYFKNVIRKCVNSIAIMLVTTFVLPLIIFFIFQWLLKEIFGFYVPTPNFSITLPQFLDDDTEVKKIQILGKREEKNEE